MESLINADFTQRVVIDTTTLAWLPSPQPGVERRPLDRVGGEVARATSLVRYAPASSFPAHEHAMGEEFLVLDGVFSDEHGDYPSGTYVRNPPGSRHSPRTTPGCTILVKLRQMQPSERDRVVIDTGRAAFAPGDAAGHERLLLFAGAETVTVERLSAGTRLPEGTCRGGEEMLVLEGAVDDGRCTHGEGTWIRNPDGFKRSLGSRHGARLWVKRGHLPP
jgi:anti-sigma factor ChrR (cupin superfamily)